MRNFDCLSEDELSTSEFAPCLVSFSKTIFFAKQLILNQKYKPASLGWDSAITPVTVKSLGKWAKRHRSCTKLSLKIYNSPLGKSKVRF
jgi:hypothetical protein